jgi:glycine/D-amino acid oxidase-like deaminating enzyme
VIGGGFYGCCMALFLREAGHPVVLVDRERELLTRASYVNQARVHYGYHYPRSLVTGLSCVINFPRFVLDFRQAVSDRFTKLYGIAKINSKVTAAQFWDYCRKIGAPISEAPPALRGLFDRDLVEAVFVVNEYAFDAGLLRDALRKRLEAAGVPLLLGAAVERVSAAPEGASLAVHLAGREPLLAREVFNCTYAGINALLERSGLPLLPMKHEIAEMALVRPPPQLAGLGVTVMDGPFFSTMPFPAEALHSLSHVRYTPHETWRDREGFLDPYASLTSTPRQSRYPLMVKDATRYVPLMQRTEYVRSLFEVKTVLTQNEANDGRPILLRRNHGLDGLWVVMGGKIDNIYDVMQALEAMRGGARSESDRLAMFRRIFS